MRWLFCCCSILTGCVPLGRSYVIVGLGIIRVPATDSPSVQVVKAKAIGLSFNGQAGFHTNVGYASSTTTQVGTNANLIVEVR